MTAFKHHLLPKRCVAFTPISAIARRTQTRWLIRRLDLLLAGAATLLLRLLRDAEAWATPVHIFSPPCLNVLALVRWDGDSSPFWLVPSGILRCYPQLGDHRRCNTLIRPYRACRVAVKINGAKGDSMRLRQSEVTMHSPETKRRWMPRYNSSYSMGFLQAGDLGC